MQVDGRLGRIAQHILDLLHGQRPFRVVLDQMPTIASVPNHPARRRWSIYELAIRATDGHAGLPGEPLSDLDRGIRGTRAGDARLPLRAVVRSNRRPTPWPGSGWLRRRQFAELDVTEFALHVPRSAVLAHPNGTLHRQTRPPPPQRPQTPRLRTHTCLV